MFHSSIGWLAIATLAAGCASGATSRAASERADAIVQDAGSGSVDGGARDAAAQGDADARVGSGGACDGRPEGCIEVCEGGACDCMCDDAQLQGAQGNGCPGKMPLNAATPTCRDQSECWCVAVEAANPGCGAYCSSLQRGCESDGDCAASQVCEQDESNAPCCDMPNSGCISRCSADSCLADEVCATDGHCVPRPCSDGYTCSADRLCDADRPMPDAHGCGLATCTEDGFDCGEAAVCDPDHARADARGCAPVSCGDGYACPYNHVCGVGGPLTYADGHDCERARCRQDADCDCGVCIFNCASPNECDGSCQDEPYVCHPGAAP